MLWFFLTTKIDKAAFDSLETTIGKYLHTFDEE